MNIRKSAIAMATGLALGVVSAASSAAVMKFEDNDLDFLLRGSLTAPVTTNTTLQVGDILLSIFEIDTHTIDSVNGITAGQELTGVAAIQITGISGSSIGSTIDFGQVGGDGLDGILTDNGINLGMPLGNGAAVAMFLNENTVNNLKIGIADGTPQGNPSCTGLADCLADVTEGDKYQVDGFLGDADEFWQSVIVASGGANPGTVLGLSNTALVATFNAALSNMFQAGYTIGGTDILTGNPCDPAALGCIVGGTFSGTITGGGGIPASHGAFAHSDFDATKNTIPEPATLLLLASGLFGIGASRWTKKSKV